MLHFKDYKSILCLNGSLPKKNFFNHGLPIIAADGAANLLMKMGITPDLVIGDLDSLTPGNFKKLKTLHDPDQNTSDFQKSISYLAKNNLLPTVIVGINGGFIDHVLNNINHFIHSKSVLYAPPIYGYCMHAHEKKSFLLPFDTKVSLLGIPSAQVSSQGLKWELFENQFSFPGKNSCFNRSVTPEVKIEVQEGALLILIYEINEA